MPMVKDALSVLKHIKNAGYGGFVVKNNIYGIEPYNYIGYLHTINFCRDTYLISDKSKYANKVTICELIGLLEQAVAGGHGGEATYIRVDGEEDYPKNAYGLWTITVDTREQIVYLFSDFDVRGEVGCKYYHLKDAFDKSRSDSLWVYRDF